MTRLILIRDDAENVEVRCERCAHWDDGDCALMESNDGSAVHRESKATSRDTESYHAAVRTAPDFGCVMFEERE